MSGLRGAASCILLSSCVLLLGAAPAEATFKPVTGKLNKRGYTVIAVGQAPFMGSTAVRTTNGKFKLSAPAGKMTLHLRKANGLYGGPIVLGSRKRGKRAIVGVKAGAKMGKIVINIRKGYARVKKPPRRKIDTKRQVLAKKGIPIGAANFGRVRVAKLRGPNDDRDLDGVATSLDIDDDGDFVIDDNDTSKLLPAPIARSSCLGCALDFFGTMMTIRSGLSVADVGILPGTANASAGSSEPQIAASQRAWGGLNVSWTGVDKGSPELDCHGLHYCSYPGSGRVFAGTGIFPNGQPPFPGPPPPPANPSANPFDMDGDGFGLLRQDPRLPPYQGPDDTGAMNIYHGATADEIGTGDVLIERATINHVEMEYGKVVGFVYSTPAVLASYDDGQSPKPQDVTYPRPKCNPDLSHPGPPCPLPVRAGPGGEVVLNMALYLPQRRRLGSDPTGDTAWMDIGGLAYRIAAAASLPGEAGGSGACPMSSYSATDPVKVIPNNPLIGLAGGGLRDANDVDTPVVVRGNPRPDKRPRTIDFTFNLSQCVAAGGGSLDSGDQAGVNFFAIGGTNPTNTSETQTAVTFQRQP